MEKKTRRIRCEEVIPGIRNVRKPGWKHIKTAHSLDEALVWMESCEKCRIVAEDGETLARRSILYSWKRTDLLLGTIAQWECTE